MSKLFPDIKLMVTRKNKSYLHSVYVGVFGATFNLPIVVLNGLVLPTLVRAKDVVFMYFKYMWAGVTGYADTVTELEYLHDKATADEQKAALRNSFNAAVENLNKTMSEVAKNIKTKL